MNTIPEIQNHEDQLNKLAAQRQIYSDAKKVFTFQMAITVPAAFVWAIVIKICPDWSIFAAYWGILVLLADVIVLTPSIDSLKFRAAKIQELFDCDVMDIPWHYIKVGQEPDPEQIRKFAKKYNKKNKTCGKLEDWYPGVVDQLPIHYGRLICQRANCIWDANQRCRYAKSILAFVAFIIVLVFSIGIVGGVTLEAFLLVILLPLMPGIVWGLRQYRSHEAAVNRQTRLKTYIMELWNKIKNDNLSEERLRVEARNIQNEIFDNRNSYPLVFDWFYKQMRGDQEDEMNVGTQKLVEDLLENLNNRS